MRSLYALIALCVLLPAQDDNIYWHGDYRKALQIAKETGKPLLVEFRCEA